MTNAPAVRRLASRAAANLVAVIAITAIFGLKAMIDREAHAVTHATASSHALKTSGLR